MYLLHQWYNGNCYTIDDFTIGHHCVVLKQKSERTRGYIAACNY